MLKMECFFFFVAEKPLKKAKTTLKEFWDQQQKDVKYTTKESNGGFRSTVYCPSVGCKVGELKPTKKEAEESAASKACEILKIKFLK